MCACVYVYVGGGGGGGRDKSIDNGAAPQSTASSAPIAQLGVATCVLCSEVSKALPLFF